MKKAGLKKYAVALMVVIGLTAALTGVASAEMTGEVVTASQLEVRFGDNGAAFTMTLENNDTAAAIKKHVGTADWRLDRKSTRLNSSHRSLSRMPSSA